MENQPPKNTLQVFSEFSTHEQRDAWLASLIVMATAVKPGSPDLNEQAHCLLLDLYGKTLGEVGRERFEKAFVQVLESSTFRPDIAEIRRAAGVNQGIVDPVEVEALEALWQVFAALRKHGPRLMPVLGPVLNDGRGADGTILRVPERGPATESPVFTAAIRRAIVAMGYGDRQAGLDALRAHPAMVTVTDENTTMYHVKNAAWVERRWVSAYREAR